MREVVLRIAHLVHTGRLDAFAQVVLNDPELAEATRLGARPHCGRERPARGEPYLEHARQRN